MSAFLCTYHLGARGIFSGATALLTLRRKFYLNFLFFYMQSIKRLQYHEESTFYLENVFDQQFYIDLNRDKENGNEGNKLRMYSMFKDSISPEKYLRDIKNRKVRHNIPKFRISAHNLKIETGGNTRPHKTPLQNRTCDTYQGKIEDEFHLIECPRYSSYRDIMFLKAFGQLSGFQYMNNTDRFKLLMKIDQNSITREFIQFIQYILNERGNL